MEIFLDGQMIELAKSKYGHFLAMKMLKYLTKNQIKQVFDTLVSHLETVSATFVRIEDI